MPTFTEFQWAAFLYWAVSYGGNIGGDKDYVPLMTNTLFLEKLRSNPEELNTQEIREQVILFLNQWKCMVKDDEPTAAKVKKAVIKFKQEASYLGGATILSVNSLPATLKNKISSLYNEFDNIPHFGPTATSKLMHILNPHLFVMWDGEILKHYGRENLQIDGTGNGYVAFLSMMSQMGLDITADFQKYHPEDKPEIFLCEKLEYRLQKSLAKFIDEYNWITITKEIAVPPRWWPQ